MVQEELFSLALGSFPPWKVDDIMFKVGQDIRLVGLQSGMPRAWPREQVLRHMNLFQHSAYLHAHVPALRYPELLGCFRWRPGPGSARIDTVARLVREADRPTGRLWRVIDHHVGEAYAAVDWGRCPCGGRG